MKIVETTPIPVPPPRTFNITNLSETDLVDIHMALGEQTYGYALYQTIQDFCAINDIALPPA